MKPTWASVEAAIDSVFLSTFHGKLGCTAIAISSDEEREYRVILLADDDGTLWGSCTCRAWRYVGADCKHQQAVKVKWAAEVSRKGAA